MDQAQSTSGEFGFTRLERVIYGAGRVRDLGRVLERYRLRRALIVTGASLGRSALLDSVKAAAGTSLGGVFSGAKQHSPARTVDALADQAREAESDVLISFGGGSPNDTAKAAALRLMREQGREVLLIAIPTTLSAGEYTAGAGITNEETREKTGVGDSRLQARVVILDPELTQETPAWLWAGTAMRALDHAVEGVYSSRHQPLSDLLSARAIALLDEHLLRSLQTQGAEELEHRLQCQLASWFSIFGAMNTRMGISHALGHQIGPFWNVPHGFTSCITLPHVMRFMAEVAPERCGPIAEGLGIRFDRNNPRLAALECADRVAHFIRKFEVPTRLRDVGVPREELGKIASIVLAEVSRGNTVGRAVTQHDIVMLLEAAY
ncbi:MAG TPA: iron-containing alcohol dehydrogenase [Candidatus Binataceae bacterium]|nr:iron-containing alcohol dehydrogenase [Candidatus Binataceae bacterium]